MNAAQIHTGEKNMNQIIEKHPEPLFARENILLLNGEWDLSFNGRKAQKIRVPYCIESELSGVGYKGFIRRCKYSRTFVLPEQMRGRRVFLCFGAVSNSARVRVNGKEAGSHEGAYTPFRMDVTDLLKEGENLVEVSVRNSLFEGNPTGKQSPKKNSFGCFYTRCTGIWQSVWLEGVPQSYLTAVRFYPSAKQGNVRVQVCASACEQFEAEVRYGNEIVGTYSTILNHTASFTLPLAEKHLWEVGQGRLYEVKLRFGQDVVYSYFGLRDAEYEGLKFLLNGQPVFQRLVLDQGYYPKGVYTPEREEDFAEDIQRATALGFNGARLHQKLFDPRYLYECDRQGFLVWGEYASWGVDYFGLDKFARFVAEWREAVERDFNHPCIVTWCPLNETWGDLADASKQRDVRFVDGIYALTKALDPTRPCVDVSGGMHGAKTDIADYHCYDGYDVLKDKLDKASRGEMDFLNMYLAGEGNEYAGEPQNLSEFGGVTYGGARIGQTQCVEETTAWGYDTVSDEETFVGNYAKSVLLILGYENLSGFCYTQLYDVEQEQNGLYTYDRGAKFSEEGMRRIREANLTKAASEK